MEKSSDRKNEQTIRHQFDSFAKMVLRGEANQTYHPDFDFQSRITF